MPSPVAVQKTGAPRLGIRHRRIGVSGARRQVSASVGDVGVVGVPATRFAGGRFQLLPVLGAPAAATFHRRLHVAPWIAYLRSAGVFHDPHQVDQVNAAFVSAVLGSGVVSPAADLVLLPILKLAADAGTPAIGDPPGVIGQGT